MRSAETRAHSAVHVIKGAVIRVLGQRFTASVHVSGSEGVLAVQMERRPTAEEIAAIEGEANKKIAENAEVIQFEMERQEAEGHFGKSMYDLFPIPEDVRLLKIVRIPDWEVNCCNSPHVENTGEIGAIKIDGSRHRNSKGVLELKFHISV